MAIATNPEIKEAPVRATPPQLRGPVKEAFLITNAGLTELVGSDALDLEKKIKEDNNHPLSSYEHYDDDKHVWAYWAVETQNGIQPLTFPDLNQYSSTAPQLYAKAVSYVQILAHAAGLLNDKKPSIWDKMMKPTTIIVAIIGVIIVVALFMVAAQG